MAEHPETINLQPIGTVHNEIRRPQRGGAAGVISDIYVNEELAEALDGIEAFAYIIIIYWLHLSDPDNVPLKVHPRGNPERPLRGVFATRSPNRPNRIGITTVKLLKHEGNRLTVTGLDAIDGTPVLDIKPYMPAHDDTGNNMPHAQ